MKGTRDSNDLEHIEYLQTEGASRWTVTDITRVEHSKTIGKRGEHNRRGRQRRMWTFLNSHYNHLYCHIDSTTFWFSRCPNVRYSRDLVYDWLDRAGRIHAWSTVFHHQLNSRDRWTWQCHCSSKNIDLTLPHVFPAHSGIGHPHLGAILQKHGIVLEWITAFLIRFFAHVTFDREN